MCEKYEGWANYETWAAMLWINNDPSSQGYVEEVALDGFRDGFRDWRLRFSDDYPLSESRNMSWARSYAIRIASEWLCDTFANRESDGGVMPKLPRVAWDMYEDIFEHAIRRRVDWQEIAAAIIDSLEDENTSLVDDDDDDDDDDIDGDGDGDDIDSEALS